MDEHFIMWVKTHCPFCIKAKDKLFDQKASYTVYAMDNRLEELDDVKKKWAHPTVPVVVLQRDDKEELIGGYSDLEEWFNEVGND